MDGWETRRRRTPGYDWCVIRLGMPGRIHGLVIDTNHFIGNFPERASVEAAFRPGAATSAALLGPRTEWKEILPPSVLRGGSENLFEIGDRGVYSHLRLKIFPDGGVARLRVHGEVDGASALRGKARVDLASILNGGLVLAASDMHFGAKDNLIMPGRSANMGDGWETRRRRGPGYDWLILRLATLGQLERIEVDTNHFKGNYPESCSLEACRASVAAGDALEGASWTEVLPRTKLAAHRRHFFRAVAAGPFTHVRFNIYPDGGVSRLRLSGRPVPA
jgi:allantoicase